MLVAYRYYNNIAMETLYEKSFKNWSTDRDITEGGWEEKKGTWIAQTCCLRYTFLILQKSFSGNWLIFWFVKFVLQPFSEILTSPFSSSASLTIGFFSSPPSKNLHQHSDWWLGDGLTRQPVDEVDHHAETFTKHHHIGLCQQWIFHYMTWPMAIIEDWYLEEGVVELHHDMAW